MSDCINREDALLCLTGEFECDKEYRPEELIAIFWKRLRSLPSIKQEQKTAHWIEELGKIPKCSECGIYSDDADKGYDTCCPNCGAKMVDPQKSEE